MKELINRLFIECNFHIDSENDNVRFYRKNSSERVEYYLVLFLSKAELENFNETPTHVQSVFQSKKSEYSDVAKNTSLIICVEFADFVNDCNKYKNKMLRIEEDDYWFKKYVLPFTVSGANSLVQNIPVVQQLNGIVSDVSLFQDFTSQMYRNETYFLAVQFFLKFPFLNLQIDPSQQFVSIPQLLSARISTGELSFLNDVLLPYALETLNRDQLVQQVLDPNDTAFDTFLNSFNANAQDT